MNRKVDNKPKYFLIVVTPAHPPLPQPIPPPIPPPFPPPQGKGGRSAMITIILSLPENADSQNVESRKRPANKKK